MNHPLTIVVAGASGDLFRRKIVPALFALFLKNKLGNFAVIGFSRREIATHEFKRIVEESITDHASSENSEREVVKNFSEKFSYIPVDMTNKDSYEDLKKKIFARDIELNACANKIFYLALSPYIHAEALKNIAEAGFTIPCAPEFGKKSAWAVTLVDKPFGTTGLHAKELNKIVDKYFEEDQVHKIDHYVTKRIVQALPKIKNENRILSALWSGKHIESINIRIFEEHTVGTRGKLYDSLGAIKDIHSHLLTLLARIGAESSVSKDGTQNHKERSEFLKEVSVKNAVSGQYEGYREEAGVSSESKTETYFKAELSVGTEQFKGIKIFIEHGKAFRESVADINIVWKSTEFGDKKNFLRIVLQPKESIELKLNLPWDDENNPNTNILALTHDDSEYFNPRTYPYEVIFESAMNQNFEVFLSDDEVLESWRIAEQIIGMTKKAPLISYKKGGDPNDMVSI